MNRVNRALATGIFLGLTIIFFLVLALGVKMSSSTGKVSQEFLGLRVLEATKTVSESGSSSVSMKPLPGIIVPLLGPALIFLAGHIMVRSQRKRRAINEPQ